MAANKEYRDSHLVRDSEQFSEVHDAELAV